MNHIPSSSGGSGIAEEIYLCTASIFNDVETLFERLPGLRSVRETFLLDGAYGRRSFPRSGSPTRNLAEETVEVAQTLTNLLCEKAKERPRKEKNLVEHISLLFQEETRRLAEWTKSQPATTNEITAELSELMSSLSNGPNEGLSSTLNDFQTRLDSLLKLSRPTVDKKGKDRMDSDYQGMNIVSVYPQHNISST
ncbi:hypothetical protein ACHAO9_009238 [Fusarium lateritium]